MMAYSVIFCVLRILFDMSIEQMKSYLIVVVQSDGLKVFQFP